MTGGGSDVEKERDGDKGRLVTEGREKRQWWVGVHVRNSGFVSVPWRFRRKERTSVNSNVGEDGQDFMCTDVVAWMA